MADGGTGEKTEEATPRRKKEAREKGNVAKGKEISQAFTLLASFLMLYFLMQQMIFTVIREFRFYFSELIISPFSINNAYNILMAAFSKTVRIIAPIMIVSAAAGVLVNFLQIGPLFTSKPLVPDFKKIDPIKGAKNLFSLKSLMELFKSLFKLFVIAAIAYNILSQNIDIFERSIHQDLTQSIVVLSSLISQIAFSIIAALIILGIIDLLYQRWQHNKDLKMSKYEVKQERKEMEGDPMINQQRKQRQREISMNRMMSSVKDADVVITNPTHIAVALKYDLDEMDAPEIIAKGEGFVAQKIKEKAREAEVEIVENKPLARSLNSMTEIGDQVPVELYQAVAEILARIFKENKKY
ncbi:flagellar biosynthetic protein FlhB [Halanaerobium congolense]|jgi:flagellar biosynthetic protein FlhB|uniref:Flagellar biosynthetic protein FlhB n=1 Tax=Halanaerobium congolense TaxID=54121 RepID=A0A1G8I3T6_9FIRM|nr:MULTISPECIES: flagellar biosynthesis protein FlhB [Halanaerobium]KXS49949.1 MAG: flagellar biosynthetic protein FlhB [Halanaerobium sp. T82-1]OEG61772.1 MAG: flagellar biosynthesis protein FlhB [Halanaerobium sp. MDAL1]PUU92304.1 MAG: flagellar biosynthetic protein FlhB [Halanaerobium sp.]PUU92497.1 MAG: Flagellar biosynthesis protein FlhB [Halanaerobium sp.]TDP26334.1 flagellar biosynthetic protein FlhB [Halanaerobium congolense]